MRPYQVFAGMSAERAERFLARLAEQAAPAFQQAVAAAAVAMKARPGYLRKQPFGQQASMVRRMLSRVASDGAAEELLAVYFLECRKELLIEWLDLLGLAHEEGFLEEDAPAQPEADALRRAFESYQQAGEADDEDRLLLVQAFAAQGAIDWPALDALIPGQAPG